jgi:hypothetical protein
MKKEYESPQTAVIVLEVQPLMAASGVDSPDRGISYGGVDEDGEFDPD